MCSGAVDGVPLYGILKCCVSASLVFDFFSVLRFFKTKIKG